jgi:hypothetical protein
MTTLCLVAAVAFAAGVAGCGHAAATAEPEARATSVCAAQEPTFLADLCAMQEPSLAVDGPETYRFVWLRSFRDPIAMRLARTPEGIRVLSVEGDAHSNKILRRHEFPVTDAAWAKFVSHVEAADFWNLPKDDPDELTGEDGADWILEGRRNGKYHVVVRWSPKNGPFRDACTDLIGLSGLLFPPAEVY